VQTQLARKILPLCIALQGKGVHKEKYHVRMGGLWFVLLNLDRVLRKTPKPPAQSTVPRAVEIKVGLCQQDEVPQTPVTPEVARMIDVPKSWKAAVARMF
jgi:hypothetical protein